MYENTRSMDRDPSMENRSPSPPAKRPRAAARLVSRRHARGNRHHAQYQRGEQHGFPRLELRHGDEIILFSDNHPCNKAAWEARRQRYGFTIVELPVINPHPGAEYYIEAVRAALTPRTRLLSITHLTTPWRSFPAKELCQLAREYGVLTLLDGAQTYGLLAVDLADIQPISTRAARTNGSVGRRKSACSSSTPARSPALAEHREFRQRRRRHFPHPRGLRQRDEPRLWRAAKR